MMHATGGVRNHRSSKQGSSRSPDRRSERPASSRNRENGFAGVIPHPLLFEGGGSYEEA